MQNLDLHIAEYNFPPQPKLLVTSGANVIQYPRKRRKKSGWESLGDAELESETLREQLAEAILEAETLRKQIAEAELGPPAEQAQPAADLDFAQEVPEPKEDAEKEEDWGELDKAEHRDLTVRKHSLIQKLCRLRQKLAEALVDDDMLLASELKGTIEAIKIELRRQPICSVCYIEKPSRKALERLGEKWYGVAAALLCGSCGKDAGVGPLDAADDEATELSLKNRAYQEVALASRHLPSSCSPGLEKELKALLQEIKVSSGRGRGWRGRDKSFELASFGAQLYRTYERLLLEPKLTQQQLAVKTATRAIELR